MIVPPFFVDDEKLCSILEGVGVSKIHHGHSENAPPLIPAKICNLQIQILALHCCTCASFQLFDNFNIAHVVTSFSKVKLYLTIVL